MLDNYKNKKARPKSRYVVIYIVREGSRVYEESRPEQPYEYLEARLLRDWGKGELVEIDDRRYEWRLKDAG